MTRYLVCLFFFFSIAKGYAQYQVAADFAFSQVHENSLVGNIHGHPSFSFNFNYTFLELQDQKLAFFIGSGMARKGYTQRIEEVDFKNHFIYLTYPIGVSYKVFLFASLQAGISTNLAVYARQHVNNESFKLAKDLRRYELAGFSRLSFLDNHIVGFYLAYQHSLLPLLKYHQINEEGNFTGLIKDIRFQFFQLGININILNQ